MQDDIFDCRGVELDVKLATIPGAMKHTRHHIRLVESLHVEVDCTVLRDGHPLTVMPFVLLLVNNLHKYLLDWLHTILIRLVVADVLQREL